MDRSRFRRRTPAAIAAALALPLLAVPAHQALAAPAVPSADDLRVPIFSIASEGLTAQQARVLADRAGIAAALRPDGSFAFTDSARYSRVPSKVVGKGLDEHKRPTVTSRVDVAALARIQVPSADQAVEAARSYLQLPEGYQASPIVDHTTVTQSDRKGRALRSFQLDTTVSFALTLGNLPVVGPGAKAKISLDSKGVVELSRSLRDVRPAGAVSVI